VIRSCKLNGVDLLAYLTDVLQRIISGRTINHELHTLFAMELASTGHVRCPIAPLLQFTVPTRCHVNQA
jgi:IS66 C-terminal element